MSSEVKEKDSTVHPTKLKSQNYRKEGWKFYLSVQPRLEAWWDEFNEIDRKTNRYKYRSIRHFTRTKSKNSITKQYLRTMFGPQPKSKDDVKEVPWIGDWESQRKNGFTTISNKARVKGLAKLIQENIDSQQSIKGLQPVFAGSLEDLVSLEHQLKEAFGPIFLDTVSAEHPKNRTRFKTYIEMKSAIAELASRIAGQIMRVNGVNPTNPNEMWGMAQLAQLSGQVGAAGALTGVHAAANGLALPGGINISKEALMIANHLSEHAAIFEKPLPVKFEKVGKQERIEEHVDEEHKANGKSNGKAKEITQ